MKNKTNSRKTSRQPVGNKSSVAHLLVVFDSYEQIKNRTHPYFKTVKDLCAYHNMSKQNLSKLYHRFIDGGRNPEALEERKSTPHHTPNKMPESVEKRVVELRYECKRPYEVISLLKSENAERIPCAATVKNIWTRHNINKLSEIVKEHNQEKRKEVKKIVMKNSGDMIHIDLYQTPRGILADAPNKALYILGAIDGKSRVCWLEIINDKTALTTMFATIKTLNMLNKGYGITAKSIMTDNGAEFGSGKKAKNKDTHPFERLLVEMGIKHIYTVPYKPQSNGKIERFWRTMREELLDGSVFKDLEDFNDAMVRFIVYYNEVRPHSALQYTCPKENVN